jgi:protein-disulfide isomerase
MPIFRRSLLIAAASGAALTRIAQADEDETRAPRTVGNANAKVKVNEYFSLTCTHCAAFAQETFPQVQTDLIDKGIVQWVYHDYPLDQVALTAAMVARYLPVDRYEPFVNALLASQMTWAFNRGNNPTDELWKMAALAGMGRPTFDKAINDTALRNWILQQQKQDTAKWNIDSTPSFVIDGKKYAGEMSYDSFRKLIPA